MRKVQLQTSDGRAVTSGLIPPFSTHPDVIFWGTRTFTFATAGAEALVYREAFAVALVSDEHGNFPQPTEGAFGAVLETDEAGRKQVHIDSGDSQDR